MSNKYFSQDKYFLDNTAESATKQKDIIQDEQSKSSGDCLKFDEKDYQSHRASRKKIGHVTKQD
jgi:hypothetical protein